jgi:hypothetical protein
MLGKQRRPRLSPLSSLPTMLMNLPLRDFVIGDDQLLRLPDPIYLEQNASYRFRLRLKDYAKGAKANETVIRLLVLADNETSFFSDEIYLGIISHGDSFTSQTDATVQMSNEEKKSVPDVAPDGPSNPRG